MSHDLKSCELLPGPRSGTVAAPVSKSHLHRLLIADFLAGDGARLADGPSDPADIAATKRCLRALAEPTSAPILDCGESGSTLRFLAPVAAALGKRPVFRKSGRLADRPSIDYSDLTAGRHLLAGDVSSQFVTGLLYALPLLKGDSEIRFTTPLESRGYVDLTLEVLRGAGITIREVTDGFDIPGGQTYRAQPSVRPEGDWSGAAFWLAMNALGSAVKVTGLNADSTQPDRKIADLLNKPVFCGRNPGSVPKKLGISQSWGWLRNSRGCISPKCTDGAGAPSAMMRISEKCAHVRRPSTSPVSHPQFCGNIKNSGVCPRAEPGAVDVSACPDIFPVLTVVAAAQPGRTVFTGTRRLRLKESDRVAAMADVLARLGRETVAGENDFTVVGSGDPFPGGRSFTAFGDHRVAMSVAVAATAASGPLVLDDIRCAAKSYPDFFALFSRCRTDGKMV